MNKRVLLLLAIAACSHASQATSQSCETSADCTDPAMAYCVGFVCQACDGMNGCTTDEPRCSPDTLTCVACVGDHDCDNYTDAPHCAPTGGCVGCIDSTQCASTTPTCDQTTSTCRACAADADCASRVCESPTCADATTILYATPNGNPAATCEQNDPCSLTDAISKVDLTHVVIKLLPGEYLDNPTIATHVTVLIDGSEATYSGLITVSGDLSGAANVTLAGMMFGASGGGQCSAGADGAPMPTLSIIDSTFLGGNGGDSLETFKACNLNIARTVFMGPSVAILAQGELGAMPSLNRGAVLTIDRSLFVGGLDGEPQIGLYNGSYMTMTNSVVTRTAGQTGPPIDFRNTTGFVNHISFSTFYGPPMACGSTSLFDFSDTIWVSSTSADASNGTGCAWSYSLLFPQKATVSGSQNKLNVDPVFANLANNDFHLLSDSPAIDAADPQATDDHDYDGTPRPQNGRSDIGAFEYKP